MKTNRTVVLMVAVFAAGLIGCASGGSTVAAAPMEAKLGKYKKLTVNATSSVEKSDMETTQLGALLVTKLRQSGMFDTVTSDSRARDGVLLNAKIVQLRKVSTGKRLVLGAMAGRGSVAVDAELVDARSGKRLGTFRSEGKTSAGTVFAGTTEQAIERVAEQIAEFVKQNM